MDSVLLALTTLIFFPIWHQLISIVFVLPKFKIWRNLVSQSDATWKNFKSRVLWHNDPPHKLSPFWGTFKQVISFLGGASYLFVMVGLFA